MGIGWCTFNKYALSSWRPSAPTIHHVTMYCWARGVSPEGGGVPSRWRRRRCRRDSIWPSRFRGGRPKNVLFDTTHCTGKCHKERRTRVLRVLHSALQLVFEMIQSGELTIERLEQRPRCLFLLSEFSAGSVQVLLHCGQLAFQGVVLFFERLDPVGQPLVFAARRFHFIHFTRHLRQFLGKGREQKFDIFFFSSQPWRKPAGCICLL